MSGRTQAFRIAGSRSDAAQAVLAALPKDTVVRGEDDGVGRFAGERTLVIVGRGERNLQMFRGTWGGLKRRLDQPQLLVTLDHDGDGTRVTLEHEAKDSGAATNIVFEFLGNAVTIGALLYAFFMFRGQEVNVNQTALIAVGGGAVWTTASKFIGKAEVHSGLDGTVLKALDPLRSDEQSLAHEEE